MTIDKNKVFDIVAEVSGLNIDSITENTEINDFGISSIMFIDIIVKIEMEFDIDLDDDDLELSNFTTLSDLIDVINKVEFVNE